MLAGKRARIILPNWVIRRVDGWLGDTLGTIPVLIIFLIHSVLIPASHIVLRQAKFGLAVLTLGILCSAPAFAAEEANVWAANQLTTPQWLNPAEAGKLTGRALLPRKGYSATPVVDGLVILTDLDGGSVEAVTDSAGQFEFPGVAQGIYAVTVVGRGTFGQAALHVVDSGFASASRLPRDVEISVAPISYALVRPMAMRYLPPISNVGLGLMPLDRLIDSDVESVASRISATTRFRVARDNGDLRGRVLAASLRNHDFPVARISNVFLIQKGRILDKGVTAQDGTFVFRSVELGEYGLMAIGPEGMAVVGFEVVDETLPSNLSRRDNASDQMFVSMAAAATTLFQVQLAPVVAAVDGIETAQQSDQAPPQEDDDAAPGLPIENGSLAGDAGIAGTGNNLATGQYGGGGGGGTGGGFGGGLGGLASLAGLGALAGLSDSGGGAGGLFPPAPASPSVPVPQSPTSP